MAFREVWWLDQPMAAALGPVLQCFPTQIASGWSSTRVAVRSAVAAISLEREFINRAKENVQWLHIWRAPMMKGSAFLFGLWSLTTKVAPMHPRRLMPFLWSRS